MVIGTAFGLNAATDRPRRRPGLLLRLRAHHRGRDGVVGLRQALRVALAADTVSIAVMEIVDNRSWSPSPARWTPASPMPLLGSLAFALVVAFVVTVPVNRWLIARGKGHAVVHGLH